MNSLQELIIKIESESSQKPLYVIGLDGIGGSGKSTLARKIKESLQNVTLIGLDDFRSEAVYEVDRKRLIETVLSPIHKGEVTKYQKWVWGEEKLSEPFEIKPEGIFIIEGVTALHPELLEFYDLTIWVELAPEEAFKRGLHRDKNEYGVDTEKNWIHEWIPFEQEYIKKYDPKSKATITFMMS